MGTLIRCRRLSLLNVDYCRLVLPLAMHYTCHIYGSVKVFLIPIFYPYDVISPNTKT